MLNLFLSLLIFACGIGCGALWRECFDVIKARPPEMHGMYGHPGLSRWFYYRDQEADPELRAMPLREYIRHKGGRYED